MAVPRSRLSNARKNIRRSHHAKKGIWLVACANCGAKKAPHTLCSECGVYSGRKYRGEQQEAE